MRISWGNSIPDGFEVMSPKNGYGYATERIIDSLKHLGHEVTPDDATADVHIHFDQPQHFKLPRKGMYSIMYLPWESSELHPGWLEIMNSCDEVWTPSALIAQWFKNAGVLPPVFVFEHGVDAIWTPKKREVNGTFKFLHVGAEAARKGGTDAMKALRLAFPRKVDVSLTMKMASKGWHVQLPRINNIEEKVGIDKLVDIFHEHHVYLYPSYGEGFGLTPLQALSTGMPTITVPAWAPYADFIDPKLSIDSRPIRSPWPRIHPGLMLEPDMDSTVEAMRYAYNNYEEVESAAQNRAVELRSHYDWISLTDACFKSLENRLENS